MTNPTATPTTVAYRHQVALSAATGQPISPVAYMAFGSGATPYSPDEDVAMASEFARVAALATVSGPELTVSGTLTGATAADNVLREVGIFTESGVLLGRRVMQPKEFEPEGAIDIEIVFEY